MSPEKTTALILSLMPYRETSTIIRVLTPEHGLVSAVARGIRRNDSKAVYIDRGFLVDMLLYFKAHRELHTSGTIHITHHFPATRAVLTKTMIRDAVFELILKSLTQSETHPELFDLVMEFLDTLERSEKKMSFPLLWHFLLSYCDVMGFRINLRECLFCGKRLFNNDVSLVISRGGIVCSDCPVQNDPSVRISAGVLSSFHNADLLSGCDQTPQECLRITKLLYSYCRYHFDIKSRFNTLDFLESMVGR